jgi:GT2 family glycosyltransferase
MRTIEPHLHHYRIPGYRSLSRDINVVILTYNNRELLNSCVSSVEGSLQRSGLNGQITVVDNNSGDGTAELIRNDYPSVHYIQNSENLGTARGFNLGIDASGEAGFTMLMNDDVELFPDTIEAMIERLEVYPGARGIPACPVYPDGSSQRVKLNIYSLTRIRSGRIRWARFPGTTACLYHTDVFRALDKFDEFYFFYNEDLDLALRAKRAGMKFIFDPSIKVVHHLNQGRAKGARYVRPHLYEANYYYYRKNYGVVPATLYLVSAVLKIRRQQRQMEKRGDVEQIRMLGEGRDMLRRTARHFGEIVHGSRRNR